MLPAVAEHVLLVVEHMLLVVEHVLLVETVVGQVAALDSGCSPYI